MNEISRESTSLSVHFQSLRFAGVHRTIMILSRHLIKGLILLACLSSSTVLATTDFIDRIPDFTQTDIDGQGTGGGQQYCAPVAVSNSFSYWLKRDRNEQKAMVMDLAQNYMKTSTRNGTGTTGLMNGVDRYAKKFLSGYTLLEYEGWRKHPKKFATSTKVPDTKRLRSAVSSRSTAWLNIGWYKAVAGSDDYKRIGGHWVTLVGTTRNKLIIHDPAPRAGRQFSNEFVSYSTIENGKLTGSKSGLPTSAKGYIRLENGMHLNSKADHAILDGVVYFSR